MRTEWLHHSSDALEMASMFGLALGRPSVLPLRPKDEDLLDQAEPFSFGAGRVGWSIGKGPVVLLVHGYSGRGVQMAALAREIASHGFRAVFFDAGGHGASRVEKIGFFTFIHDTRDSLAHLGAPVFAMAGHSAGGLRRRLPVPVGGGCVRGGDCDDPVWHSGGADRTGQRAADAGDDRLFEAVLR